MKLHRLIQVTLLTLLAGCAAQQAFDEGRSRVESGDFVGGMLKVEEAKRLDPANAAYREYAARQRELALQQALALADAARLRSDWNAAEAAYRHMLEI
ncbi:MAG: hypothetical protein ACREMY_07065, partial [bacterium]